MLSFKLIFLKNINHNKQIPTWWWFKESQRTS